MIKEHLVNFWEECKGPIIFVVLVGSLLYGICTGLVAAIASYEKITSEMNAPLIAECKKLNPKYAEMLTVKSGFYSGVRVEAMSINDEETAITTTIGGEKIEFNCNELFRGI